MSSASRAPAPVDPSAIAAIEETAPDEYKCPIGRNVMIDPVNTSDHKTYDREAIERWFAQGRRTSPIDNTRLASTTLVPNYTLKSLIDKWRVSVGLAPAPTTAAPGPDVPSENTSPMEVDSGAAAAPAPAPVAAPVAVATGEPKWDVRFLRDTRSARTLVRVSAPANTPPLAVHLVLVLDVSGSMAQRASKTGEGAGLTRLDLVKHTTRAAIRLMRSVDMLSIVAFETDARVVLSKRRMDDAGKRAAEACLANDVKLGGSTNMYLALKKALGLVGPPDATRLTHVVLLTDGQPDSDPPMGWPETVKRDLSGKDVTLSTIAVGTGADINSSLLASIARVGGGAFRYIPDASVTGTVIIHLVANTLNVAAKNVPVVFKTGTTRVLPLVFTDFAASILAGEDDVVPGTTVRVGVSQIVSVIPEADQWQNVAYEEGRARFVEALGDALLDPASQRPMLILVSLAETFRSNGDERLKRIADDITHKDANLGQIVLALRNWREWGQHYLPAVHNAHHRGERASFKEASAKNYGGPALEKLVDEGERIFVQIPPPLARADDDDSDRFRGGGSYNIGVLAAGALNQGLFGMSGSMGSAIASAGGVTRGAFPLASGGDVTRGARSRRGGPTNMSSLMAASGGCFGADAYVREKTRGFISVAHVQRGDAVYTGRGNEFATVSVAVHFPAREVSLSGSPSITPWHPIRDPVSNEWVFPVHRFGTRLAVEPVYNLVLDMVHQVQIFYSSPTLLEFKPAYIGITLAHGFTGPVVGHAYFGTTACLSDLMRLPGFQRGVVHVPEDFVWERDAASGTVVGLKSPSWEAHRERVASIVSDARIEQELREAVAML